MVDEGALAGGIPLVHCAYLRHGDVRLVDHEQEVVGEEVEQRVGRLPRLATVEVPRIVLDARTEAQLLQHLEIEGGAHPQALGLEQLLLGLEFFQTRCELVFDRADRTLHGLGSCHVVRGREDRHRIHLLDDIAGERMQQVERLDLVAEQLDADGVLLVHRDDLDRVTTDAEVAAGEVDVVAVVLHRDELADEGVAVIPLPHLQRDHRPQVLLGRTEAIDARHRRDHDDVAA